MKTTLTIQGMHCTSCKMLIEDECSGIAGVKSCTVDVKGAKAVVEYDTPATLQKVKKAIGGLGTYTVS